MKANLKFRSVMETGHTPEYWKQHCPSIVVTVGRCTMDRGVLEDTIWQGVNHLVDEILDEQHVCRPGRASVLIPQCYEALYYHSYLCTLNKEQAKKMARDKAGAILGKWQAIPQPQDEQQPDEQPDEQPGE